MAQIARITGAALALGLAIAAPAHAETEPPALDAVATAKQLMLSGRNDEAKALLQDLSGRYRDSNDVDFLLGLLAIEGKEYERAIRHFRAVLVRQPGAVRVRLELARAFYLDRDYENAFRQFQQARAGNPPAGVIASIDGFLAAIRQQKSWSYSVSVAIAPDTNINNGTSSGEVVLFGLPFELSEDTRRRSGVGLALEGSAEFAPRIGERMRLRLGAAIQRRDYRGTDFDDTIVALHAGPKLVIDKWDLSATLTAYQRRFGGQRLNEAVGARLEATHYTDPRTAISLGAAAQRVRYPRYPLQDGPLVSAWAGVARALTPESSVMARLGVSRKSGRVAEFGNWSGSVAVGYHRDLPGGFTIYAEPSYARWRYDAADAFFGERRKDSQTELRLTLLNRRILLRNFTPRVGFSWARRRSNIDLYDYSQRRFEFGFTSSF